MCNAFAKAPPPKPGFYIRPDQAFTEWWENHKGRPPIPPRHVIPVLSAMRGHPESPCLWEKHADAILHNIGLTPMVHEPCLYSGVIDGERIIFKRQVDDFAIAMLNERTANLLLHMLDKKLTMPIKPQGLLDIFNGIDVTQRSITLKLTATHTSINSATKTSTPGFTPFQPPQINLHLSLLTAHGLRSSTPQLIPMILKHNANSKHQCRLCTMAASASASLFG